MSVHSVMNNIKSKRDDALTVIGAMGVTYVSKQLRKNKSVITANLLNGITYASNKSAPIPTNTDGVALQKAKVGSVKIGTTVVYGARVEFGFIGTDSLGRHFNQQPKSYIRKGLNQKSFKVKATKIMKKGLASG